MNKPRKVLLLMPALSGGGAERAILDVLTHLDSQECEAKIGVMSLEGDYHVPKHFLLKPHKKNYIKKPSQEKYSSLFDGLRYLFRTFGLVQDYLTHFKPDVVMTITESMNILSQFYRKLFSAKETKWILRVGNNSFRELQDAFPNPLLQRLMVKIYSNAYQNASHILAISHGVKSMLVTKFGVHESRISVIHNPVNYDVISVLAQEPLDIQYPFLLSIGRLSDRQKRLDILVEAYHTSDAHYQGIPLCLLGKFNTSDPAYQRVKDLGLDHLILFKGFQKNPYQWMSRALALIHTAEWEGFCSVLAESLACGTPVITTDCDYGPREIVQHGINGFLVPVNDILAVRSHINKIILDDSMRSGLSDLVHPFDSRFITEKYQNLFKIC